MTFSHRFAFEFSGGTYSDGGVVEIATDAGATWQDVSTVATVGYNGVLDATAGNPLGGRSAFGNLNASHPAFDTVALDLGTALAGQTFQLRFRIGTDTNSGAAGWELDDLVFTGLVTTPFPVQVVDYAVCATPVPDAGVPDAEPIDPDAGAPDPDAGDFGGDGGDGGCCSSGRLGAGNVGVAAFVLVALLRRRRRVR